MGLGDGYNHPEAVNQTWEPKSRFLRFLNKIFENITFRIAFIISLLVFVSYWVGKLSTLLFPVLATNWSINTTAVYIVLGLFIMVILGAVIAFVSWLKETWDNA